MLLYAFGSKLALRSRALRVALQLLPLVVVVATLLNRECRSTMASLTQIRVALADWRIGLAGFVRLAGTSIIARQGAPLLVGLHVSVSLTNVLRRDLLLLGRNWLLAAVCANIGCWDGVVAGLTLRAVVALVGLLLQVGNLLLEQVVVVNGHAEIFLLGFLVMRIALDNFKLLEEIY